MAAPRIGPLIGIKIEKTREIVQNTLQNVAGITQDNINTIAAAQSTNIINIAEGLNNFCILT